VSIDWTNENREKFRIAFQRAYPDYGSLEMFVDEKLDENLATISENVKLDQVIYKLIKWAQSNTRLDELFQRFCEANPRTKDAVITELQRQPLVSSTSILSAQDWDFLFKALKSDDFKYGKIAFDRAFRLRHGNNSQVIYPSFLLTNNLDEIQDLLAKYDDPILAIRFVEVVISETVRTGESTNENSAALQMWRDRIAQQFNIPVLEAEPTDEINHHVYLLVTLEESGPDLIVHPELHSIGTKDPIGFGATPMTCSMDEVAGQISKWIHQAEQLLVADIRDEVEVTLEIFLPCRYLGEDIATTWIVKDKRGDEVELGAHRWFLVRSTDRIRDLQIQGILKQKWQQLEACATAGNPCSKFHQQTSCPETKGNLRALLKGNAATGLKLLTQLPAAPDKQRTLLYDIIDAAIPIALWTSETNDIDPGILATEFNQILAGSVTNFADLARRWQLRRIESAVSKQIKILCDRPDRIPRLPDLINREDDDAIVA
jgi:hypothetical protein